MRAIAIVLVSLVTVAGTARERVTVRRERHPNGSVKLEAEYRHGVPDGAYRTFYPDGRPFERRHFVNGHEQGLQQAWAPDGMLYVNYEMRDGRRYGSVNATPCLPVDQGER